MTPLVYGNLPYSLFSFVYSQTIPPNPYRECFTDMSPIIIELFSPVYIVTYFYLLLACDVAIISFKNEDYEFSSNRNETAPSHSLFKF